MEVTDHRGTVRENDAEEPVTVVQLQRTGGTPSPAGNTRALFVAAYALFFAMGISSWLPVNAIYLQMPFYYSNLYTYASTINSGIAFAMVAANVFPAAYMMLSRAYKMPASTLLAGVLAGDILLCALFSVYCSRLNGPSSEGFALLLLASFLAGTFGCMTNVLFWPFAAAFSPIMLNGLSVGTSFSAIFPVLVDVLQGAGNENASSRPMVFFAIMSVICVISLVSYFAIQNLTFVMRVSHSGSVHSTEEFPPSDEKKQDLSTTTDTDTTTTTQYAPVANTSTNGGLGLAENQASPSPYAQLKWWQLRHSFPVNITTVQFVSCMAHFFLMGINSYLIPCGADFNTCFTIMLRAGMIGNPIGRLLSLFLKRGPHIPLLALQLLLTVLMFVCGRPGGYSAVGLYALNALEAAVFGINNTLVYQGAASGVHMERQPLMAGGPVAADNFQLSRALGFVEQMGSTVGSTMALILTITGVLV